MEEYSNKIKQMIGNDEELTVVRRTRDYDKFKLLTGNRKIGDDRVKKIRKSLEAVGYILNPIIINENFEIIDGQGRFTTFKEQGMPIDYVIAVGAGVEECVNMNINQKPWDLADYIDSKADLGKEPYIRLRNLKKRYPMLNLDDIECAVSNRLGSRNEDIKLGTYTMTEEEYTNAIIRLDKVQELLNKLDLKSLRGVGSYHDLTRIYLVCMDFDGVDMNRLEKVILRGIYTAIPFKDAETCAKSVAKLYDSGLRDKRYIDYLFKQRCDAITSEKTRKNKEKRYGDSMKLKDNINNIEFDFRNKFEDSDFDKLSSSIKMFLTNRSILEGFKDKSVMPLVDIYKLYYEYCIRNRIKPLQSLELYKQLEFVGFKRGVRAMSSNSSNKDKGQYQAAYIPEQICI